jgi:hypothetical protein
MMGDWKKSAVDRRDARNTKSPEVPVRNKSKKNTRIWCKGKIGEKHVTKCVDYVGTKKTSKYAKNWRILVCTVCGKELETYFGTRNKPEWVKNEK